MAEREEVGQRGREAQVLDEDFPQPSLRQGVAQRDVLDAEIGAVDEPVVRHGVVGRRGAAVLRVAGIAHAAVLFDGVEDAPMVVDHEFRHVVPARAQRLDHFVGQQRVAFGYALERAPQVETLVGEVDAAAEVVARHRAADHRAVVRRRDRAVGNAVLAAQIDVAHVARLVRRPER